MNRFTSSLSWIFSSLAYTFSGGHCRVRGKKICPQDETVNSYMGIIQSIGFKSAYIDDMTTQIIYEGLLVQRRLKKDYSASLYDAVAGEMKITSSSLTSKVIAHIVSSYLESFAKLDAAFVTESRRMRYIMTCYPKGISYYHASAIGLACTNIPSFLTRKKVIVLSDHSDLIKVQFVRLKATEEGKELYNYSLLALDPKSIVSDTDRSLYFESLDALRMKILNLAFDAIIIHDDIYSLPLASFINQLSLPSFIVDDTIYGMYSIAFSRKQITDGKEDPNILFLEDYDKEDNEDFNSNVYLAKKPLIAHRKDGKD
jgi:hypothetical protein